MKANNQQKIMKRKSYENKTQGYETTINNDKNTSDKKVVFSHKLAKYRGALAMMCERNEKP
jgi:hypothetical protein